MRRVKQLIEAGAIGKVKLVQGQICIEMTDVKRLCALRHFSAHIP